MQKLIIGLGNPGEKYKNNRHNVGYMVVDKLKTKSLKLKGMIVVKTNTFMNESGSFVRKLTSAYSLVPSDLYVVHDDLDIPLGSYKIQFGKGPKEHNGILSIESVFGTKDFWRVRIGIENRQRGVGEPSYAKATEGKDYVLQDFSEGEKKILDGVIKEVIEDLIHRIKPDRSDKTG